MSTPSNDPPSPRPWSLAFAQRKQSEDRKFEKIRDRFLDLRLPVDEEKWNERWEMVALEFEKEGIITRDQVKKKQEGLAKGWEVERVRWVERVKERARDRARERAREEEREEGSGGEEGKDGEEDKDGEKGRG